MRGGRTCSFEISIIRLCAVSISFSLRLWNVEEKIKFEVAFYFFVWFGFLRKQNVLSIHMKEIYTYNVYRYERYVYYIYI